MYIAFSYRNFLSNITYHFDGWSFSLWNWLPFIDKVSEKICVEGNVYLWNKFLRFGDEGNIYLFMIHVAAVSAKVLCLDGVLFYFDIFYKRKENITQQIFIPLDPNILRDWRKMVTRITSELVTRVLTSDRRKSADVNLRYEISVKCRKFYTSCIIYTYVCVSVLPLRMWETYVHVWRVSVCVCA